MSLRIGSSGRRFGRKDGRFGFEFEVFVIYLFGGNVYLVVDCWVEVGKCD